MDVVEVLLIVIVATDLLLAQGTTNDTYHITLGVIADSERVVSEREADVNVTDDVTVVWQYANYSELFQVFKSVRHFDTIPEVDVIVLSDYTPPLWGARPLLDATSHKGLLKLTRTTVSETHEWRVGSIPLHYLHQVSHELLQNITDQYLNGSEVPTLNSGSEPVCKQSEDVFWNSSSDVFMGDTLDFAPSQILARLARLQEWTTLHVFYETATERDVRVFSDTLSDQGIAFTLYNVADIADLHEFLVHVYEVAVAVKREINLVIICRLDCLFKVLYTANHFDDLNKENQSLLSLFSRWLLMVYNYTPVIGDLIKTVAAELSNVAVVAVPELKPVPAHSLSRHLRFVVAEAITLIPQNETATSQQFLTEQIKMGLLNWDPASTCIGYVVMTLLWTKEGRGFSDIGHASLNTSLHLHHELFPNIKYGYSQRHFRIVTKAYGPYVVEEKVYKNGTKKFAGVFIDMLEALKKNLNFTYTLMEPVDDSWGSVDREENGTLIFNGMIGMLQRHEVDMSAATLAVMPERETVSDFAYPIYYDYSTIIYRRPDPAMYKWRTLLDPLKPEVLLFIGVSLLAVTVVVFIMEKYNAYYEIPAHATLRRQQGGLHTPHDSFWYIYGCLLCQGGINLPDSFAGRTIVSGWWIFCIVIVGTYCGNLIAFLTITKDVTPFNTLDELALLKGEYKWGTLGGTNWELVFTTSQLPDFRKVGDAMMEFNKSDTGTFHMSLNHHIERVKRGGYAYIGDVTAYEAIKSTECDLRRSKQEFLPMKLSFAFQENSPHTAIFSEQIMKILEAGLFAIWKRNWLQQENFCLSGNQPEATPISLTDVQSAFYVCILGFVVGGMAFAAEWIMFWCRKNKGGTETPTKSSSTETLPQTNEEQATDTNSNM